MSTSVMTRRALLSIGAGLAGTAAGVGVVRGIGIQKPAELTDQLKPAIDSLHTGRKISEKLLPNNWYTNLYKALEPLNLDMRMRYAVSWTVDVQQPGSEEFYGDSIPFFVTADKEIAAKVADIAEVLAWQESASDMLQYMAEHEWDLFYLDDGIGEFVGKLWKALTPEQRATMFKPLTLSRGWAMTKMAKVDTNNAYQRMIESESDPLFFTRANHPYLLACGPSTVQVQNLADIFIFEDILANTQPVWHADTTSYTYLSEDIARVLCDCVGFRFVTVKSIAIA